MKNYERVLKILDLSKDIIKSEELKIGIFSILSDITDAICSKIDGAKKFIEDAVNEANEENQG